MSARPRRRVTVVRTERPQIALQIALIGVALCVLSAAALAGEPAIEAIVNQVSSPHYQSSHLTVENMGLGQYGGPAYNMGYRNRNGWAGVGTLGNQETRLYLQDVFSSMGLQVSLQGTYMNVIGELPGTTTPENVYIIGAHYDHVSNDRPGGDDNASGTAGVLEAARILSQYQFESTIRFVGFNAEEDGLLGSRDYVDSYVIPHQENIVGMTNLDMILRPGWDEDPAAPVDLDLGTRTSHAPSVAWANAYRQAAADYVPTLVIDQTTFHVGGGSDQDPFAAAGYPAFLAIENTAQEIWGGAANAYYHTSQDASDRLANDPNNPSGVIYDYPFATDVVRAAVALTAQEAGLVPAVNGDFDNNGLWNCADINSLVAAVAASSTDLTFDMNGDGMVTAADVTDPTSGWLTVGGANNPTATGGNAFLSGDADLDGFVDGQDFIRWNDNKFTLGPAWCDGDFTVDGFIDGQDFIQWNANKLSSSDTVAQVPEPWSFGVAFWLIATGIVFWRRPRSQRALAANAR
jgi:hypothetical protein